MLLKFAILGLLASSSLAQRRLSCKKNGQKLCGGQCVDVMNTPSRCGDCKTKCSGSTPLCKGGICVSQCSSASPTLCGKTCTNTNTDPNNCSTCGNKCDFGQCEGGSCVTPSNCTPGQRTIQGRCFNIVCGQAFTHPANFVGVDKNANSVNACTLTCARNPNCHAAGYVVEDGSPSCVLYSSVTAADGAIDGGYAQQCS